MGICEWYKSLQVDFDGQKKAEKLCRTIILVFGVVGICWGYAIQQFSEAVQLLVAGFIVAAIFTIPPWPMFRRKPLKWQKVKKNEENKEEKKESKKKK